MPLLFSASCFEGNVAGLRQRFALKMIKQYLPRFIVGHIVTAIHMTIARAVLQWDIPLPSCRVSDRSCVGSYFTR